MNKLQFSKNLSILKINQYRLKISRYSVFSCKDRRVLSHILYLFSKEQQCMGEWVKSDSRWSSLNGMNGPVATCPNYLLLAKNVSCQEKEGSINFAIFVGFKRLINNGANDKLIVAMLVYAP